MVRKLLVAGVGLAALLAAAPAFAQVAPPPAGTPLMGAETVSVTQNHAPVTVSLTQIANLYQPQTFYVSSAQSHGFNVGSDSNAGTSAAPLLTCDKALALAPSVGVTDIKVNGSCTPASGSYAIAKSVTIEAVAPGAATIYGVAGYAKLFDLSVPNSGAVALKNLTINTAGTSQIALYFETMAGEPGLSLLNDTFVGGTGAIGYNADNICFDVDVEGGSQTGQGLGMDFGGINCGTFTFNGFTSKMTPATVTGGGGVDIWLDADGSGATQGSVHATLTNTTTNSTLPTLSTGEIMQSIRISNIDGAVVNGGSITLNSQPGDTNAQCRPVVIDNDPTTPLMVTHPVEQNLYVVSNCGDGGHAGPSFGYDGYPYLLSASITQSGTTIHFKSTSGAGVLMAGENISDERVNFSMAAPETLVAPLTTQAGDVATWQGSVSKTIASPETVAIDAMNMVSNPTCSHNTAIPGPLSVGANVDMACFMGWTYGGTVDHVLVIGGGLGLGCKGATGTVFYADIALNQYQHAEEDKGCYGYSNQHVSLINTSASAAGSMLAVFQETDVTAPGASSGPGAPYSLGGTYTGDLIYVGVASNSIAFVGYSNTWISGTNLGPAGNNTPSFSGGDYFNVNATGHVVTGNSWSWDTSSSTSVATNVLATWQGKDATAVQIDPQLLNVSNLNATGSNLDAHPSANSLAASGAPAISNSAFTDFYGVAFAGSPSYGAVQAIGGLLGLKFTTWTDTQACSVGQVAVDAAYLYVCTAPNTVKRTALSTF